MSNLTNQTMTTMIRKVAMKSTFFGAFAISPFICLSNCWSSANVMQGEAQHATINSGRLGREILQELIATKPVHSNGSLKPAQLIADRLIANGFDRNDVHVLAPTSAPSKGNLVVRLRGKAKGKPILYIGHLDVVEAKREDWTTDPFVLTEKDAWLYGRGTMDILGADSAMLASLIRLKKEGYVPERDLILALTADEEAGGDANGVQWLLKEHRDLLDASIVINPDAGEAAIKNDKKIYLTMQTSEKVFLTFGLEITDKGGHSSRPTKDNPIFRMARALQRLGNYEFPLHLTETVKLYFQGRSQMEVGQKQKDMLAISGNKPDLAAAKRLSQEVETNILMRTTCTATEIHGGHAENALPQSARATIQCRVIPGETQEQVEAQLKRVLADSSVTFSVITPAKPSPESAPKKDLRDIVASVTHSIWPGVLILPSMSAGASDGVYTRGAGLPTYGIDGMFDDLDDARSHGRDERVHIKVFEQEVEFMYRLMKALDRSNN